MDTDATTSSVGSGAEQSMDIAGKLSHDAKQEGNRSKSPVDPTMDNFSHVGTTVEEGDENSNELADSNVNQEHVDKDASANSIIWLGSIANVSTVGPDDKGEDKKESQTESTPCTPSNDVRKKEEAMEVDEDIGAVGGTVSPVRENETEEQNVDEMVETSGAQHRLHVKCCNPSCCRTSNEIFRAPLFVLSCYDIRKKKKRQFICRICFDGAVGHYERMAGLMVAQRPLHSIGTPNYTDQVELVDSSDEDEEEEDAEQKDVVLSPAAVSLVKTELGQVIEDTFKKVNAVEQIKESTAILREKITRNEISCENVERCIKTVQKALDNMQRQLHTVVKRSPQKQLPEITISDDCTITNETDLQGQQVAKPRSAKKPVQVNGIYFAMLRTLMGSWTECKVMEEVLHEGMSKYMVQFLQGESHRFIRSGKHIACSAPSSVRLAVGMRIIAKVDPADLEEIGHEYPREYRNSFYAGIIAETLNGYNNHRYLVIFDNGYTHYARPWNVRLVCEQSSRVWEDVDPHSREFVRDYMLGNKTVRAMVQAKEGQRLKAEKNGIWLKAVVRRMDSSLVLVYFPSLNRSEWIFRGSKRLEPVFQNHNRKRDRQQISKFQKRNIPSIEYIIIDDDDGDDYEENTIINQNDPRRVERRPDVTPFSRPRLEMRVAPSVASAPRGSETSLAPRVPPGSETSLAPRVPPTRLSTTEPTNLPRPTQIVMNKNIIYCDNDRPEGRTNYYTTKRYPGPIPYVPHECGIRCYCPVTFDLTLYNLLARPLICGWERQICKARGKKADMVVYRGPCGRRLRYMYELHKYLRITKTTHLNVENFDFDPEIRALATFTAESLIYELRDLSGGKEQMPVSCVNYYDDTKPPPCEYSTKRIPTEGVNLNLDDDFLCGCDCEDDCVDKSRCQCWGLTIQSALNNKPPDTPIDDIGYVYKRLDERLLTGIYECNSRCKCKVNECLNRVVQHPLQTKLQVFKTSNRGWGIRALNDIPKGSFICIYTGHLLTEETSNLICEANEDKTGDEYFADLDYIETVEELKEGYESEAIEPVLDKNSEPSDSEADSDERGESRDHMHDSDDDFTPSRRPSTRLANARAKQKDKKSKSTPRQTGSSKQEGDRERVNLIPSSLMGPSDSPDPSNLRPSVRQQLFGENEHPYVMDAKKTGNLGRYFNHSCVPNLVVQNVFVDTHDLRFPWVAFFASRNIKAGSELTWNYSYDVGSVPGKVLFCHCGETDCRKRLL